MRSIKKRIIRIKEDQQSYVRREKKSRTRSKEKKIIKIKEDYQSTVRKKEKSKTEKLIKTE